jgi:hypothetical protein
MAVRLRERLIAGVLFSPCRYDCNPRYENIITAYPVWYKQLSRIKGAPFTLYGIIDDTQQRKPELPLYCRSGIEELLRSLADIAEVIACTFTVPSLRTITSLRSSTGRSVALAASGHLRGTATSSAISRDCTLRTAGRTTVCDIKLG